jgi:hypothetical protein
MRLLSKSNLLQPSRVGLNRDAKWLEQQLWVGYIVPRYKKALNNFDKRTGGGSGTKFDFHEYCCD